MERIFLFVKTRSDLVLLLQRRELGEKAPTRQTVPETSRRPNEAADEAAIRLARQLGYTVGRIWSPHEGGDVYYMTVAEQEEQPAPGIVPIMYMLGDFKDKVERRMIEPAEIAEIGLALLLKHEDSPASL